MSKYELTLASKKPEKPSRRGVTMAPANGVKMIVRGKKTKVEKHRAIAI